MDSSRYKRRQTQTRQTFIDGFADRPGGQSKPLQPMAQPLRPQPVRPAPVPIVPQQRINEFAPRTPATTGPQQSTQPLVTEVPAPVAARRLPRIDMGLPGDESTPSRSPLAVRHSRLKTVRRWALRSAIFAVVAVIAVGSLLFSQGYLKLHKVFKGGTVSAAALQANVDPNLLKGEGSGRINVLLMGRGGGNHDGPDLTDTMMLASVDPVNHTETLLSIPRDLWVDVPNQGAMKINAAWETGEFRYLHKIAPGSTDPKAIQAGYDEVDQVVESVLGVQVNYNVLVDFQAFQQAVDTVGGITVNVPEDLVDPTMAWENNRNPVLAKAGSQTFDGKHALIYVRSRETTSDFARAQRQRAVLLALKQRAENLGTISNPLKLSGLINAFGNNVATDFSLNDASRMYNIIKGISDTNTISASLADENHSLVTTANMNGQSIVQPKAGLFHYDDIQNYVRSQLKDPYLVRENAKVLVLNGTTQPGLATTQSNALKSYGYTVIGAASAPTSGYSQTIVVDLTHGKDKYTKHYLEQRYNVTATGTLPDNTIAPNGADFVIIVGSDETTSYQG